MPDVREVRIAPDGGGKTGVAQIDGVVAPLAEAPPAEVLPAEAPPVGNRTSQVADRFERALSLSRLVVIIPVIVLLLSAVASFAYGTEVFVRTVRSLDE